VSSREERGERKNGKDEPTLGRSLGKGCRVEPPRHAVGWGRNGVVNAQKRQPGGERKGTASIIRNRMHDWSVRPGDLSVVRGKGGPGGGITGKDGASGERQETRETQVEKNLMRGTEEWQEKRESRQLF